MVQRNRRNNRKHGGKRIPHLMVVILAAALCLTGFTRNPSPAKAGAATVKETETAVPEKEPLQASVFQDMTEDEIIELVGPYFTENQAETGILASVSLAQFILESGYGRSELAENANNCFGMKKVLSGNTWEGSVWDGESVYTKQTKEEYTKGEITTITADFRKYPSVAESIADHSAYLLGAMNEGSLRYAGLAGEKDYRTAIQIIKDGGYATSSTYVDKLCQVIERWDLTRFDRESEGE